MSSFSLEIERQPCGVLSMSCWDSNSRWQEEHSQMVGRSQFWVSALVTERPKQLGHLELVGFIGGVE